MLVKGILFLWSETGSEGGWWAIQDERAILSDGAWSYDGLIPLQSGDHLKVFAKNSDEIVWEGEVNLQREQLFTKTTADNLTDSGLWIHDTAKNVPHEQWVSWFIREHRAELSRP